ncbi:MAG: VanZ family protein [Candidatus Sericytochromatia bacterium]|nr:VanZ family protein [Candidatus Sericytochromatia bacterium]
MWTWPRHPLRWAIVVAWMGLIFWMSSQSASGAQSEWLLNFLASALGLEPAPPGGGVLHLGLRKLAHFSEYLVLSALFLHALEEQPRRVLQALLYTVAYAVTDEWHQTLVPSRVGALTDVLIDSAGAFTATLPALWARRGS